MGSPRAGAVLPFAASFLAVAGVILFATTLREGASRRTRVHVDDLGRVLEVAASAQAEAVAALRADASLGAALSGGTPRFAPVHPESTRRACAADCPALTVGDVVVKLVRVTARRDLVAGAAPHGVLETAVRVASTRGGARTVRQRRLFVRARGGVTLVGEPLATVVE